jgi:aryl-alcohol dehydrogenase-like predicted oxidoreductase
VSDHVSFAGSEASFAPLGVGTWAWGDRSTWGMGGYDASLNEATIAEAWTTSIESGVTLFDTAEVYGDGESERIIGRLLAAEPTARSRVVIATKFMPSPWKLRVGPALRAAAVASLDRLGIERIDLYQLHGPVSLRGHGALADALAAVHDEGLVGAVGVSNYSEREMRSIHRELASRGVPLAANQIECSLLRRRPETSGLLGACAELGVVALAYSPIGQGRLTGKYSAANPPPGRRNFSAHPMERVDRIVAELVRIGAAHDGRTPAQVALRWLIEKGTVPIPGAKNGAQAAQNGGALGWSLGADDVAALDAIALDGTRTLQQRVWQHG